MERISQLALPAGGPNSKMLFDQTSWMFQPPPVTDAYIWRLRKDRNFGTVTEGVPQTLAGVPLRANIRETVDPLEFSVQGGEAKAA